MVTHRAARTAHGRVTGPLDGESKANGKSRARRNLKRKLGREVMNVDLVF